MIFRIVTLQLEFNDLSLHECLRHHGVGVAVPSKVAVTDLWLSVTDSCVDLYDDTAGWQAWASALNCNHNLANLSLKTIDDITKNFNHDIKASLMTLTISRKLSVLLLPSYWPGVAWLLLTGVGDSSVVEPAPPDMQVLRGCGFESRGVLLLGPRATDVLRPA